MKAKKIEKAFNQYREEKSLELFGKSTHSLNLEYQLKLDK